MKLIVCLDDHNGMAFNNRRQSEDRILRDRIIDLVGENNIWMNLYSEKQFQSMPKNTCVDDDFLRTAGKNDYCFAETDDLTPYMDDACEVVIFRWNRRYPADLYFPMELLLNGFQRKSVSEFAGNSHEMITQEVYVR